jgi:hypothetical protein
MVFARPFVPILAAILAFAAPDVTGQSATSGREHDSAAILNSTTFLAAHPDMRWRKLGIEARKAGRAEQARDYFRRAASYADKISQAAYAEMLWKGEGGATDRPLAYAWMDLAAQRGTPALLVVRERYWAQLSEAERERARIVGQAVYAEYGDKVAKPRQEREMRAGIRQMTGSRTGAGGTTRICTGVDRGAFSSGGSDRGNLLGGGCGAPVSGEVFYADHYWQPAAYWAWQNEVLEAFLRGDVPR